MLSYISGTLAHSCAEYIVVENQGIGYKIFIPPGMQDALPEKGEKVKIYTHLYFKEDRIILYGFYQLDDVALFELLLTVSGIGPRGAFAVIGSMPAANFYLSVINEDVDNLIIVPGIGKKTAKRIILELKEKISSLKSEISGMTGVQEKQKGVFHELNEALASLGYGPKESAEAASFIEKEGHSEKSLEEILRLALKYLAGL